MVFFLGAIRENCSFPFLLQELPEASRWLVDFFARSYGASSISFVSCSLHLPQSMQVDMNSTFNGTSFVERFQA